MLGIVLTLSLAHATSIDKIVRSRLALLQLAHRLGHLAPIAMSDPDRTFAYQTLFEADYRGEVFRLIECCGDIAPARGNRGPLARAFAKDGYGDDASAIRAELRGDIARAAAASGLDAAALANRLERYVLRRSPAAELVLTRAFLGAQQDFAEVLGRSDQFTPPAPPPCECPLIEPRSAWWRRVFRRGEPS